MTKRTFGINMPALDWYTLTSRESSLYFAFRDQITSMAKESLGEVKNAEWYGYTGYEIDTGRGTVFAGQGWQDTANHFLTQVTGTESQAMFPPFSAAVADGAHCTRLDIQITIAMPPEWEQIRLFNRLKKSGKHLTNWEESNDKTYGLLATVYIGGKKSDRMVRVYQKIGDGMVYLRFESQMRHRQANTAAIALASRTAKMGDLLRGFLQWVGDKQLSAEFLPILDGYNPHLPISVRMETKTERWLKEDVYPVFMRVISDHNGNNDVLDLYNDGIRKVKGHTEHGRQNRDLPME